MILSKMPQNTFFFQGSLCVHFYGNTVKNTVFQAKILFSSSKILFSFVRGWHLWGNIGGVSFEYFSINLWKMKCKVGFNIVYCDVFISVLEFCGILLASTVGEADIITLCTCCWCGRAGLMARQVMTFRLEANIWRWMMWSHHHIKLSHKSLVKLL